MPRAVLDENVSLQVADRLKILGYEVLAVAQHPARGMRDEAVFSLVVDEKESALLVTRDGHFANPIRFSPSKTAGILHITAGNLRGVDEADLVEQFLRTHSPRDFSGHLVFLSRAGARIR